MVALQEAEEGSLPRGAIVGGRYRVEAEIGSGAMGRVYRVVHDTLELPLALKILHPELAVVPEVRQRIEREAKLSALLDHPSVVQITDYGVYGGRPYLVMRLVEGEELASRMERGPLAPKEVVEIGVDLCEGLSHAHGLGLVHRDLKPDNVLLTARGLRILDFGLARAIVSDDPRLTRTGLVCGTPRYMSPEQASGDPVDPRSDIYAVGVLLHEMLRGEPMFDGPNAASVLRRQIVDPAPPLELKPDSTIDTKRLTDVISRALAKDPAHRYADASALQAALQSSKKSRPPRASPRWAALAILFLLVLVGGITAAITLRDPLLEARAAFGAGQLKIAEDVVRSRLRTDPSDAQARMLLGHVAWAKGNAQLAARSWTKAVEEDPSVAADYELLDALPAAAELLYQERKTRPRAEHLIETIAAKAPVRAAPMLARLTTEAPSFRLRRKAFEGLERVKATDAIDAYLFLSTELDANRSGRCPVRRWYVERLIGLEDERAATIVSRERSRQPSDCLAGM